MTLHVMTFDVQEQIYFIEVSYRNLEKRFLFREKKIVISDILVLTFNQRNFTLQLIKIMILSN